MSWNIVDVNTNKQVIKSTDVGPYRSDKFYSETYCLTNDSYYQFTIFDTYGDGICCGWGHHEDTILMEGADFDKSETLRRFGNSCPSSPNENAFLQS
jgi:hypothetical protein